MDSTWDCLVKAYAALSIVLKQHLEEEDSGGHTYTDEYELRAALEALDTVAQVEFSATLKG